MNDKTQAQPAEHFPNRTWPWRHEDDGDPEAMAERERRKQTEPAAGLMNSNAGSTEPAEARLGVITKRIRFTYRNWRDEISVRTIEPTDVWFGSTEWHPEPQWLMTGCDLERGVLREFAMRDMEGVTYADQD